MAPSLDGRTVGWQLQARQYRLIAESVRPTAPGATGKPLGVAPEDLATISPWFDFTNAREAIPGLALGPRASGRGVFGPVFRYQYLHVPPNASNREVLDLLNRETNRLEQQAI